MIIAIDGPAGTGKSTIASHVARALKFAYFDTGAMYRSFTWHVLREKIDIENAAALKTTLENFHFDIRIEGGKKVYFVNDTNITEAIRSHEVTEYVSKVAALTAVRHALVPIQKAFGAKNNAVFEGRDMGSVVFPKAELKIFLTASARVRAERRLKQNLEKDPSSGISLDEILKDINARDLADRTRKHSPLIQAPDAVLIDTSHMTIEQVIHEIIMLWTRRAPSEHTALFYRFCRGTARVLLQLFYRLKVHGIKNIPPGAAILAANHVSYLDPPIVGVATPFPVHFFAKASLFHGKILRFFISRLNTHPLQYGNQELSAVKLACELLEVGKKVVLFPEGERSFNGQLKELKAGVARIALRVDAPIVPIYIEGAFKIWPRMQKLPRFFGKMTCHFGKPIDPAHYRHLPKKEAGLQLTQDLADAIAALKERT